jgi:thioredoxin-related protein
MTSSTITWGRDVDVALEQAKREHRPILIDFTAAPGWSGCARLEAEVYPDPRVAELITRELIPVRAHIKEQPQMWKRFGTRWTPTVLFLDWEGKEQFRIEGYLPAEEFLGQIELGLGYISVADKDWQRAEEHFAVAADRYAQTEAGPEGLYWRGVARYSANHDGKELQATARAFENRYTNTAWAKRASVWKPKNSGRAAA